MDTVESVLVVLAVVWGGAAGALLPRAIHRFSAPAGEPWHERCPGGHPLRGWTGPARCPECAAGVPPTDVSPTGASQVDAAATPPADPSSAEAADAPAADVPALPPSAPAAAGHPVPTASGASYGPGALGPATATALVCAALAAATGARPELGVWLLLAPVCVLLAAVDLRVRRLPDPLTLPLAAAAVALLGLAALLPEHAGEWTTSVLGAFALGAGYFVLFLINPGGMGFGDVKLALGAGAALGWYGWGTVMLGTFAGFLLGALYGGALVVARRADRRTAIPFGPFLIGGALLGVLAGAYTA
ncbi:prepilin peptidase [Streptomyces sp. NPDC005017]|uniref:prepilin peptidase n=1 Tax=Streptomyces sp. NPDC005017 TaxID=3364706 RepID=UPI00367BF820